MKTTSKITFKSCLHAIKLTHCQNEHSSGYTYTTILKRTIQTLDAIFNANMPLPVQAYLHQCFAILMQKYLLRCLSVAVSFRQYVLNLKKVKTRGGGGKHFQKNSEIKFLFSTYSSPKSIPI